MNTVYFFTDVVYCEQSPIVLTCKQWRQALTELNVNFTIKDIRETKTNREFLQIMYPSSGQTPTIVIKDSNNILVTYIDPTHVNTIIQSLNLTFTTSDEYIATLKTVLYDQLVKYEAV